MLATTLASKAETKDVDYETLPCIEALSGALPFGTPMAANRLGLSRTIVSDPVENRLRQLEAHVSELSSREEINEVLRRYCRAVDRHDIEGLKACYFPEGTDCHGRSFSGNVHEFAEFIFQPEQLGGLADSRHFITNSMIVIDGGRAFAETSFLCTLLLSLEGAVNVDAMSEGRYFDLFECRDGTWKILHRLMVSQKMVWRPCGVQPYEILDQSMAFTYPADPAYRGFELFSDPLPEYKMEGDCWSGVREFFSSADRD